MVGDLHFPARVNDVEPKPAFLIDRAADPVIGAWHVRRNRQIKPGYTPSIGVSDGAGNLAGSPLRHQQEIGLVHPVFDLDGNSGTKINPLAVLETLRPNRPGAAANVHLKGAPVTGLRLRPK